MFGSGRSCVVSENVVVIFRRRVAGEALCVSASSPGLPFVKSANPQPPDAADFFESLTMN